jgi:hypothetical protein
MYEDIEAQLQAILQLQTTYFPTPAQVTRGDWNVTRSGVDTCAVLYPGAFDETGYAAANTVGRVWTVHLDLSARISGSYHEAMATFILFRDAVLVHLQKYPKLNGLTIGGSPWVGAVLSIAGDEPQPFGDKDGGGPFTIDTTLDLRISEQYFVASVE